MPSLLPGYEYDIFISYRHKDNKGQHWVTEFVDALKTELEATFKDDVTIYFDQNPHDGLLETHNVDKSLEGKLKCLVFIPILSQTYCDPKSFAWQHEFCAFNKLASEDQFGRDVRLSNGNVASRILCIKIHDLDADDKSTIENETGGPLRAIEFIYKEPGVNRPLKSSDSKTDNQNKTDYRNQVNKVANAIKDIVSALKNPAPLTSGETTPKSETIKTSKAKKIVASLSIVLIIVLGFMYFSKSLGKTEALEKSIAVLPFTDMSPGKDQEYLSDGIAEDIITSLSRLKDLKVIGRTSSFQFKGEKIDLREIGQKLNVATILEGSIMQSGNTIRITAQLIDVRDGSHIWSERYDKPMDDIFSIQDEIAKIISDKMALTILRDATKPRVPTQNLEAYENVLKGQYMLSNGLDKAKKAKPFFEKAIELDPNYADAYLALADVYFFLGLVGDITPSESIKEATLITDKLQLMNSDPYGYHIRLFMIHYYFGHDWSRAEKEYNQAVQVRNEPDIGHALFRHDVYNDSKGAIEEMKRFLTVNPLHKDGMRLLAHLYLYNKEYTKAKNVLNDVLELDPAFGIAYSELGLLYIVEHEYILAEESFRKAEELSPDWGGKFGRLMSLKKRGKVKEAKELFESIDTTNTKAGFKAWHNFAMENFDQGFEWLNKSHEQGDPLAVQARDLPMYFPIQSDPRYIEFFHKMKFRDSE